MTNLWTSGRGHSLSVTVPLIFLHTATVDDVPVGLNLTARDSRDLAAALLAGVSILEDALPARCDCGEPIGEDEHACFICELARSRARRATIRAVD